MEHFLFLDKELDLYETNLKGHWDAMDLSSISKDQWNNVNMWSDSNQNYDLMTSNPDYRPKYVTNAINSLSAIDFSGKNVGLVSEHKYSNGPNDPFTWIMAVQTKASDNQTPQNIFSTSDNNWQGLNINRADFYPVAASTHGIHVWVGKTEDQIKSLKLPKDKLIILSVKYDGKVASISWGMNEKGSVTPSSDSIWRKGQPGYVAMGLAIQNNRHDYSGYIGEVLAYDVELESSILEKMIVAMSTKWTTGKSWNKSGYHFQ